ncbi:MAG: hypothetical protein ACPF9U_05900 [Flavobacteriaceae bacterium]
MPTRQRTSRKRFLGSKQGLLFLVFAAVIWTLSALSETYTTTVPVQFNFKLDTNAFVLQTPRIEVPARVSSTGFSVLYRRLFPRKVVLSVKELPIQDVENPAVNTAFLLDKYNRLYTNSSQIRAFVPEVISLPIAQAAQKSFTPTLASLPKFADGYQLASPLKFSVDSITAYGSKVALEKLHHALFKLASHEPLRADFLLNAALTDSIAKALNWSTTTIQVSGSVDRYSDVSFVLPVKLTNTPENANVTIAPKQVEIKFAAPLGSLRSIDKSSLGAEVFFEKTASGQLSVRITGLPATAKQLTISPPTVSYFIIE